MKKSYTTPEVSVVLFENEDIVTTSTVSDNLFASWGNGSITDGDIISGWSDWE